MPIKPETIRMSFDTYNSLGFIDISISFSNGFTLLGQITNKDFEYLKGKIDNFCFSEGNQICPFIDLLIYIETQQDKKTKIIYFECKRHIINLNQITNINHAFEYANCSNPKQEITNEFVTIDENKSDRKILTKDLAAK